MKRRLFVDMDGTLAEWKPTTKFEDLYEKNYFFDLAPYENVVEAVRKIVKEEPDIEVFILSAYLTDSDYALTEKQAWLDKYLPEIDQEHRIFCTCQTKVNKKEYAPGGILETDRLLDDYTMNLNDWEPPAVGIKLINGINDTHKSWIGERISRFESPDTLKESIVSNCWQDPDPEIDKDVEI